MVHVNRNMQPCDCILCMCSPHIPVTPADEAGRNMSCAGVTLLGLPFFFVFRKIWFIECSCNDAWMAIYLYHLFFSVAMDKI